MKPLSPRLCVVGSINVDLTVRAARLPMPGETLRGTGFHLGYGGKGANQAVMAARLGAQVLMLGKVGNDWLGQQALEQLRTEGIDTHHVSIAPGTTTGVATIAVDDEGRNAIVVVPGANGMLRPEDLQTAHADMASATHLLCQLEVPMETTWEALRLARAKGVHTILNPAPALELTDEVLALVDLCVPNESEAEALTGQEVTSWAGAAAAAWDLQRRGCRSVIVTLGERGALVVDDQGAEHIPAFVAQAIDTTGAGDAFIGALAVSLAEGKPLRQAARVGCAAASISVTRPGTQTSFPRRNEVEQLIA